MILWPQADGTVLATPQPAHAALSGQVMRHMMPRLEPFDALVNAATQHDCAWLPWEPAPEFDAATGLPLAFNDLPGDRHVALWEAGVEVALANWGVWEALLIMRHGSHVYRMALRSDRSPPDAAAAEAIQGYLAREAARSADWTRRLGTTEEAVALLSEAVATVDGIALGLCWGKERFDCGGTVLRRTGPFAATLDPWVLDVPRLEATATALRLPARFPDAAAMREALPLAPRETLRFTLSPA
ncbi:DUF3891 family protein [Sabulicella glaciei]|uniref:DUF3891 family protein n=1 Tax=Sabulicella glaciei TaxID=2984948 RepID=A0ABT3NST6_9PROT|nr:DUF3891 family protein [Roseococcus sp. MDT2-1-1]MCW8085228.1 DUF3891 family protein [Roseococcus sp. MDT2-1-1]